MAHGIKTVLIKKSDNLECNNNNNSNSNSNCNKAVTIRNNILIDNCCLSVNNLIMNKSQVNATNTSTQKDLTTTTTINKSLNCGGAMMSAAIVTKPGNSNVSAPGAKMGSRRIFTPQFKLQVLESYRNDSDCKGNQRATARKYGIHRRQIQKWLQCENNLRSLIANSPQSGKNIVSNKNINLSNNKTSSGSSSFQSSSALQPRLRVVPSNTYHSTQTNKIVLNENSSTLQNHDHHNINEKESDMNSNYSCFTLAQAKAPYRSDILSTRSLTSLAATTTTTISTPKYLYVDSAANNEIDKASANYYYETSNYISNSNYAFFEKNNDLPIDLSCNKIKREMEIASTSSSTCRVSTADSQKLNSLASNSPPPHFTDISNSYLKPSSSSNPIDLCTSTAPSISHKRKFSMEEAKNGSNSEKKPIKLFKPYLEENYDREVKEEKSTDVEPKQKFPIIWSNHSNFYQEQYVATADYYQATSPTYYPYILTSQPYFEPRILAPVTPSSTISSPPSPNQNYHTLLPPLLPSQASPVSGYDSSTSSIYSFNDNDHEISNGPHSPVHSSSGHYEATSPLSTASTIPASPVTQEQNSTNTNQVESTNKVPSPTSSLYDLKFKLYALDCYYNDENCKGSEKLVANKLNINCKIVEKWLRQEKDLRHQQEQQQLQILV